MQRVYFIGGLVPGAIIAIFAVQNPVSVEVRFLLWQTRGPLAAVALISATAGAVVALLLGIPEVFGARWRIRSLECRLEDLIEGRHSLQEQSLDSLKGYRGIGPVRIGNDAFRQLQSDICDELMDSVLHTRRTLCF